MKSFDEIYRSISETQLEGSLGTGRVYEHIKTGARIFAISNEDINKVFMIGFRTTPADDTGVPHIMEHSLLCGSGKFPVKDPFVELVKGSLNTFLNAMTYPDKTVYPVASCNDQDFRNLMDVYLDAVFDPNIYREKKIFEQEGWHYELSNDGELIYNGVVYNEMKGAFSSPDAVLERRTMHALFPDTVYGSESGGDPEVIPELSYEAFLDFHRTYYHPSNSWIYLYGDMDMEERLRWIDENYLSRYDRRSIASDIGLQKPFSEPRREVWYYPVGDEQDEEGLSYLSANYVVGGALDPVLNGAFQILAFLLLDAPGAPLTEALIDAGIGEDILGGYQNGIREPYFSVIAKNTSEKNRDRFESIIRATLSELVKNGISKKSLYAAINYLEFKTREADFGRTPKGLVYGLSAFDSWLYDGAPKLHLESLSVLSILREKAETGYFEELIKKYLLDNSFCAYVDIVPKKGLLAENEKRLRDRLSRIKASLSEEELSDIAREARELKAYQDEKNSDEELERIPLLRLSDIDPRIPEANLIPVKKQGSSIRADMDTNGIAYVRLLFDTSGFSNKELQYASLLSYLLGELNTKSHTYSEISDEILLNSGGLDADTVSYPLTDGSGETRGYVYISFRVLRDKLDFGFDMSLELIKETLLDDEKRIGDKLMELKSRMQAKIDGASHSAAVTRASSYFDATARFDDLTEGIAFYDFLDSAGRAFREQEGRKEILDELESVSKKLFQRDSLLFYVAADSEIAEEAEKKAEEFCRKLPADREQIQQKQIQSAGPRPLGRMNEGLRSTSMVNYVARAGSIRELPFTGALDVLRVILNYEYLWLNLRVKGGAYGCMSGFTRSGKAYLVSYRDPELCKTNEVYKGIPGYLKSLELSERDMTKYIIGAISDMDRPLSTSMKARDALSAFMSGVTDDDRNRERAEILSCTCADIRALAPYIEKLLSDDLICVIGNAGMIDRDRKCFENVRELYS